jgi:hypothetical protein
MGSIALVIADDSSAFFYACYAISALFSANSSARYANPVLGPAEGYPTPALKPSSKLFLNNIRWN